jgi:hypothetical protein
MKADDQYELTLISNRKSAGMHLSDDEVVTLAELQALATQEQRRARLDRTFNARAKDLEQHVPAPHRNIVRLPAVPSACTDRLIVSFQHIGTSDGAANGCPYVAAVAEGARRTEYALEVGSAIGFADAELWRTIEPGLTQMAREWAFISPLGADITRFYNVFGGEPKTPGTGFTQFEQFATQLIRRSPPATMALFAKWFRSVQESGHALADRHAAMLRTAGLGRTPSVDLLNVAPLEFPEPQAKRAAANAVSGDTNRMKETSHGD